MGSPSTPQEDPAVRRLRRRQEAELVRLDEEENARIRRIQWAGRGMRAFKGSPDMRLRRGDFAGGAPSALPPNYNPARAGEPSRSSVTNARLGRLGRKTSRSILRRSGP
jgi:hypothetical protein